MCLRLVRGFLIFALLVGREVVKALTLATGDETEHDFDGYENSDDSANDYQCYFHLTLPLILCFDLANHRHPTLWGGRARRL